ncbi:uncharacterized protein BDR25DRAFT_382215 [Lindgomyces ingoldianus]|uniref:Uncharacterized protein n=1 Tax=Lindgomyces ingoldianus TaxID=673940 RepID=A0ACB6R863_9PLEO|nr:uncharacterized protein BDR25DRAFT_382215 [Lindgomyces ingoldianus]KAF2475277.1 hypothetical protein BDR25DRAFT_382215 [Lindgomyces ingoldianus]
MGHSLPASTFPPGYFEEDVSQRTLGTAIAFIVLEISVVTLRVISRRLVRAPFGMDDMLIFPALLFCLGLCALAIVETKIAGIGRHLDVLLVTNPAAIVHWAKCGYAIEELYCTAVVFPKLSILSSYLRIFRTKSYRVTAYVLAAIITANGIAGVVTSLNSCRPFSIRYERPAEEDLYCIKIVDFWRWISFPNILTDVIMLVLPLPVVWSLHVSRKDKLALTLIFLTGGIGLVTSIIRFAIFFDVSALKDGTFVSAELATWSLVEPGIYLLAACLPTLRPLVLKLATGLHTVKEVSGGSMPNSIPLEWRQSRPHDQRSDEDSILRN